MVQVAIWSLWTDGQDCPSLSVANPDAYGTLGVGSKPQEVLVMKWIDWKMLAASVLAALVAILGNRQLPPPSNPPAPEVPEETHTEPAANPLDALGRLVMQGGYCSGTPIGPLSKDRKQRILSAAHCVKTVGERCQFFTRAGRMVQATVVAINRQADACLLVTEDLREPLPYLKVATETPQPGTVVFHAGFGQDQPGNVEKGRVLQRDTGSGQVIFELSVSPGDSGGGVCVDASGRLISPVCCTTRLAQVGQVYGARPEVVNQMMTAPAAFMDVPPAAMPIRMEKPIAD